MWHIIFIGLGWFASGICVLVDATNFLCLKDINKKTELNLRFSPEKHNFIQKIEYYNIWKKYRE
jgi:hypothetical protein